MKKLLLVFFLLAFVTMEAQQNRGIEKSDIRRGQTQRSIENDTLKNANPNKSAKLIVPVAIDKGLRQGITTPKQTQGATFGEKVNQGLHAAGSAQSNGAAIDTLKRADKPKGINNINGGMPNRGAAVVDTLKRAEKTKKHTVKTNDSSKRMDNGAVVDTLKRADLKKLADELVNTVDDQNDSLKPSEKAEVRGWDPKDKSTISKTRIKPDLDSKENMKIETGVINSGETVDIKKNKIDVIKGTANQSNERATGNLKNMYPPGSKTKTSRFKSFDEIENFTWELIGADIQDAVYAITITRIGNNQQPQQTYAATTTNSEISAKKVAKFKAGKALADTVKRTGNPNQGENGEYEWTVTETTTGISSEPGYFTVSDSEPCEIDIKPFSPGQKYCVGDTVNLNWSGSTPSGQVNISLFDNTNNTVYAVLATGIPNTGTYTYTIPSSVPCDPPRSWSLIVEDAEKLCLDRSNPFIIECCNQQSDCNCGKWLTNSVSIKGYLKKIPRDPKLKITIPTNFESKVECGNKIQLKPAMNYTFTAPNYVCNPENCAVEYQWEVVDAHGIILSGNGKTFNYTFNDYGQYQIIFTPICGGKRCAPCVIYVNIDKFIPLPDEPGPIIIGDLSDLPITNPNDVYNRKTGKTWMNKNLGASQVATSPTDAAAYGDLYQWGRLTDGHEKRTSSSTTIVGNNNVPGHGNFIVNVPGEDWRSPKNDNLWQGVNGINNPCPSGYRLPTFSEMEAERLSWTTNNAAGAFGSPLKWTMAGARATNGTAAYTNYQGFYQTSTLYSSDTRVAHGLVFTNSNAYLHPFFGRNVGYSVRCIKN